MECCENCKHAKRIEAEIGQVYCDWLGWHSEDECEENGCDDYERKES